MNPIITETPFEHFTIKKPRKPIPKKKRSRGDNTSEDLERALEENKRLSEKNARMKKIINAIYGSMGSYLIELKDGV